MLPHTSIQLSQRAQRHPGDQAGSIHGAVYLYAMDDDKMPITRPLHINFDEVHAKGDRALNRCERIFRRMSGGPTMADSQHAPMKSPGTKAEEVQ